MSVQTRPIIAPPTNLRRSRTTTYTDSESHVLSRKTTFTANGAGTTTTIVGANAAPATETNVVRLSDRFKLFDSSDNLKEDTVFHVTTVAVAAATTVTFAPAAAEATGAGDYYRRVGAWPQSIADLDSRLTALGVSSDRLSAMTLNDKQYSLAKLDDVGVF